MEVSKGMKLWQIFNQELLLDMRFDEENNIIISLFARVLLSNSTMAGERAARRLKQTNNTGYKTTWYLSTHYH